MFQGNNLSVSMLDDGFAELNFDASKGSVNVFNEETQAELKEALSVLEQQDIKGLLISSGKSVFVAGADISEFAARKNYNETEMRVFIDAGNNNFNKLEQLPFPVVVAINGFALGGGFEICLACDYRIASNVAKVGMPEVKLGLIPGWGGTVRLPRLIGFDNAVEWISSGKHQSAVAALKVGAVDAVVEPELLKVEGLKMLAACASGELEYQQRRKQKQSPLKLNSTEMTMAATTCKAVVAGQAGPNYPAPVIAVDTMISASSMGLEDALEVEFQAFYKVTKTPQYRALSGLFIKDQRVNDRARNLAKTATKKIGSAAVLGAGIMGGGISYQNALKGFPVLMKDINTDSLDLGMAEANKLLAKQVDRGRLNARKAGETLVKITPTLSYRGIENSDIVIEAVVESPRIKPAVLSEVEALIQDDAILVSNTSTISIDFLAENLKRPENFCGMHFFNPVHAMPLVEIIRGSKTSNETIAAVVAHTLALGKKPVVVNNCPGFFVNRVLFPNMFGFDRMIIDGADFQQVDKVLEKWGWPMGPAYLMDVVGIDTAAHCMNIMFEGYPDRMIKEDNSPVLLMNENNRHGQKNGKGFFAYEPDKRGKPRKVVDESAYELLAPHVAERREFDEEEIIARYMIPMCIEAARCFEENVIFSPAEGDMALLYGLGFPAFRGGAFRWMDEVGMQKICEMADKFSQLGALYQVTGRMREMAANGESYYG